VDVSPARDLSCGERSWASAEILPWDADIFGFPVGQLSLRGEALRSEELVEARSSLREWAEGTGARLASASVEAGQLDWAAALPLLGFRCVDVSLRMTLPDLRRRRKLVSAGGVRRAAPADHPGLVAIASTAFDFGRYHRDALFPRALADRRFGEWTRRSLSEGAASDRFWVVGPEGAPQAFMFARTVGERGEFLLGAVSREHANGLLGPLLFEGSLAALESEGVRSVSAKISAANTSGLNLYAGLGFAASDACFVYHWHSADKNGVSAVRS
jgi:hypothetical protein